MYFNSSPTPQVSELVDEYLVIFPEEFKNLSANELRNEKRKIAENIEIELDDYLMKNFGEADEKIADGRDYITDTQWEAFVPKYRCMTGMQDRR